MADESVSFKPLYSPRGTTVRLGYLVEDRDAQPFALALDDMTPLFVLGDRAIDIYYSLLLQLCDEHHMPVLVLTGRDSDGYEEQICETRFWQLNTARDYISLNVFDIGVTVHATDHVAVLVDILNDMHPLSNGAQNLLHVALWQTLLTGQKASLQALQCVLARYRHYEPAYQELTRLFAALPEGATAGTYDNVSLRRLGRTPTIITTRALNQGQLTVNMLLFKLLAASDSRLPAMFLVNPPPLTKSLFHWLCSCYADAGSPLVLFDSYDAVSAKETNYARNLILTAPGETSHSYLSDALTDDELACLQASRDQVVVRLRDGHAPHFVTIF